MNYSFTHREKGKPAQILTLAGVSATHINDTPIKADDFKSYDAIWDTGAVASVISKQVAKELGLNPCNQCKSYHVQGESIVNLYMVDIMLPNNLVVKDVQVSDGYLADCDILIGMDIINLGDFAITHPNNDTVFSFQVPPTHEIDFTQ